MLRNTVNKLTRELVRQDGQVSRWIPFPADQARQPSIYYGELLHITDPQERVAGASAISGCPGIGVRDMILTRASRQFLISHNVYYVK